MDYCHLEFIPADTGALSRAQQIFELIRSMKSGEVPVDEARITELLTADERAYFWDPSVEEMAEWNAHWKSTPVAVRTSPAMILPQWDLESMYEAMWNGEYELIGISEENGKHFLAFNPEAYPYGGVASMIAFLECFGHNVVGYDDGTGYIGHQPRALWRPKSRREA